MRPIDARGLSLLKQVPVLCSVEHSGESFAIRMWENFKLFNIEFNFEENLQILWAFDMLIFILKNIQFEKIFQKSLQLPAKWTMKTLNFKV